MAPPAAVASSASAAAQAADTNSESSKRRQPEAQPSKAAKASAKKRRKDAASALLAISDADGLEPEAELTFEGDDGGGDDDAEELNSVRLNFMRLTASTKQLDIDVHAHSLGLTALVTVDDELDSIMDLQLGDNERLRRLNRYEENQMAVRLPGEMARDLKLRVRDLCLQAGEELGGPVERLNFLRLLTEKELNKVAEKLDQGWRQKSLAKIQAVTDGFPGPSKKSARTRARAPASDSDDSSVASVSPPASVASERKAGLRRKNNKSSSGKSLSRSTRDKNFEQREAGYRSREKVQAAALAALQLQVAALSAATPAAQPHGAPYAPPASAPSRATPTCYTCGATQPSHTALHQHKGSPECLARVNANGGGGSAVPDGHGGRYPRPTGRGQPGRGHGQHSHYGPPPAVAAAAVPAPAQLSSIMEQLAAYQAAHGDYANGLGIEGEAAEVTEKAAQLIVRAGLRCCLIENVVSMLSSRAWARAEVILLEAGYLLYVSKLKGSEFSIACHRRRVYILAVKAGPGVTTAAARNTYIGDARPVRPDQIIELEAASALQLEQKLLRVAAAHNPDVAFRAAANQALAAIDNEKSAGMYGATAKASAAAAGDARTRTSQAPCTTEELREMLPKDGDLYEMKAPDGRLYAEHLMDIFNEFSSVFAKDPKTLQ
ncbi:hypothetical protein JKP88DRAFT_290541 [Tribonema minus]|uniref:Uncharacterized protein n=1 Tax=Tribonema minus TaxID=303371 RepID=A0A836CG26_9STRA|nr:hypothetical protein JKP88DRAFT_290541 [Tribonema minus]